MSNVNIIADFETSLATKIAVGGETATLVSNIDDDGETLPDGLFNFTIDGNNSSKEHILCTKTGADLTAIKSVSRQGVESDGCVREHRVGAKVIMTDFSTFKNYIDNIAIQGSTSATEAIQGVALLSVAAVAPATPIVVGDNDPRLPTTNQKAALVGTGTPNGTTGKYVTLDSIPGYSITPVVRTYLNAASPATWTKPANLKYVVVEVQAGGGGGSGSDGQNGAGCGAGAGGYSKKLIGTSSLGATETVTIGAGGAGGVGNSGSQTGATGGTSSFGAHCSATGGTGGTSAAIGGGGTGTGGDININGGSGGVFEAYGANTTVYGGGFGASSYLSNPSGGTIPTSDSNGAAGLFYGGGGGGASNGNSYSDTTGGAGGDGIVIVTEYYI
jgi:hypothetical protein